MITGMTKPSTPIYFGIGCREKTLNIPGHELKPSRPARRPIAHSAQQIGSPMSKKAVM
ncbi:MAG: hypothetical protein BWY82_02484 [Verrucomicrobia bacterium ADurb.Bin474]|nr:MAG: hypothetical protein BWY82_02484 [Verrucomicrobia bacterium ADurb.Bin474]